jgi:hypothetical protein
MLEQCKASVRYVANSTRGILDNKQPFNQVWEAHQDSHQERKGPPLSAFRSSKLLALRGTP